MDDNGEYNGGVCSGGSKCLRIDSVTLNFASKSVIMPNGQMSQMVNCRKWPNDAKRSID